MRWLGISVCLDIYLLYYGYEIIRDNKISSHKHNKSSICSNLDGLMTHLFVSLIFFITQSTEFV